MNPRAVICVFILCLMITSVSATDVQELTNEMIHYLEQYEIGNLDYMQLNVNLFSVRAKLNEMLGGEISEDFRGVPREGVEAAFGKSTELTKWVWVENEHKEAKLDKEIPR